MISCDQLPAMLVALNGGRPGLDAPTLARMRFHVASCEACAAEGGRPGEPAWCPELAMLPLALVRAGDVTAMELAGPGAEADRAREEIEAAASELLGPGEAARIVEHAERCDSCGPWLPVVRAAWDESGARLPPLRASAARRSRSLLATLARTGNVGPALATLLRLLRDVKAARGLSVGAQEQLAGELHRGCVDLEEVGARRPETIDLFTRDDGGRLGDLVTALGEQARVAADEPGTPPSVADALRRASWAALAVLQDHEVPPADGPRGTWHAVALVTAGDQGLLLPWRTHGRGTPSGSAAQLSKEVTHQVFLAGRAVLDLAPDLSDRVEATSLDPGVTGSDVPGIDGPSAGVASFVALCSHLTRVPSRRGVAYTGELDHAPGAHGAAPETPRAVLREYRVRAVGGVRQKARAVVESAPFVSVLLVPRGQRAEALEGIAEGRRAVAALHAAHGAPLPATEASAALVVAEVSDLAEVLGHAFGARADEVLLELAPAPAPMPIARVSSARRDVAGGGIVDAGPTAPPGPLVFVAHAVEEPKAKLDEWLPALRDQLACLNVPVFTPSDVLPGEHAAERWREQLEAAGVVLLLVTPKLLTDSLCSAVLERQRASGVPVLILPMIHCASSALRRAGFDPGHHGPPPATPWDAPFEGLAPAARSAVLASVAQRVDDLFAAVPPPPPAASAPAASAQARTAPRDQKTAQAAPRYLADEQGGHGLPRLTGRGALEPAPASKARPDEVAQEPAKAVDAATHHARPTSCHISPGFVNEVTFFTGETRSFKQRITRSNDCEWVELEFPRRVAWAYVVPRRLRLGGDDEPDTKTVKVFIESQHPDFPAGSSVRAELDAVATADAGTEERFAIEVHLHDVRPVPELEGAFAIQLGATALCAAFVEHAEPASTCRLVKIPDDGAAPALTSLPALLRIVAHGPPLEMEVGISALQAWRSGWSGDDLLSLSLRSFAWPFRGLRSERRCLTSLRGVPLTYDVEALRAAMLTRLLRASERTIERQIRRLAATYPPSYGVGEAESLRRAFAAAGFGTCDLTYDQATATVLRRLLGTAPWSEARPWVPERARDDSLLVALHDIAVGRPDGRALFKDPTLEGVSPRPSRPALVEGQAQEDWKAREAEWQRQAEEALARALPEGMTLEGFRQVQLDRRWVLDAEVPALARLFGTEALAGVRLRPEHRLLEALLIPRADTEPSVPSPLELIAVVLDVDSDELHVTPLRVALSPGPELLLETLAVVTAPSGRHAFQLVLFEILKARLALLLAELPGDVVTGEVEDPEVLRGALLTLSERAAELRGCLAHGRELPAELRAVVDDVVPTTYDPAATCDARGRDHFFELWDAADSFLKKFSTPDASGSYPEVVVLSTPLPRLEEWTGVNLSVLEDLVVRRDEWESRIVDPLREALERVRRVVRSEGGSSRAVSLLLLTGEGAGLPIMRRLAAEVLDVEVSRMWFDPVEATTASARGACLASRRACLPGLPVVVRNLVQRLPRDLGWRANDQSREFRRLLSRGVELPADAVATFSRAPAALELFMRLCSDDEPAKVCVIDLTQWKGKPVAVQVRVDRERSITASVEGFGCAVTPVKTPTPVDPFSGRW